VFSIDEQEVAVIPTSRPPDEQELTPTLTLTSRLKLSDSPVETPTSTRSLKSTPVRLASSLDIGTPSAGRPQLSEVSISGHLPLPYRIPISIMRESLKRSLNLGELLEVGMQTELMDSIYQDVTKHTL
jgi:hypothetical protein